MRLILFAYMAFISLVLVIGSDTTPKTDPLSITDGKKYNIVVRDPKTGRFPGLPPPPFELPTRPTERNTGYNYLPFANRQKVKDVLPWLKDALNADGKISILGGEYEISDNTFVEHAVKCTSTKSTDPGVAWYCERLSECRHIHKDLTDYQTYQKEACIADNKFAGVCCPPITVVA